MFYQSYNRSQPAMIKIENIRPSDLMFGIPCFDDSLLVYTQGSLLLHPPMNMISLPSLNVYPSSHNKMQHVVELFHTIFCELHDETYYGSPETSKDFQLQVDVSLLKFSRKYRAVIQEKELDMYCKDFSYTTFSVQHLIWHLTEILYLSPERIIDQNPGENTLLSMKLANWIQFHSSCSSKFFSSDKHELSDIFHELYRLILQGRLEDSINLLNLVLTQRDGWPTLFENELEAIQNLLNLLKVWPFIYHKHSLIDLYPLWVSWKELCRDAVNRGLLQAIFEIEQLGRILGGDKQPFENIPLCSCPRWIDMLVGMVLYCDPFVEAFSTSLMELVRCSFVSFNASKSIDKLLLNLFTSSLLEFFLQLCEIEPSWCLAAHLADLFTFAGYHDLTLQLYPITDFTEDKKVKLNEHIVHGYASSLMKNSIYWTKGADYLIYSCPSLGRTTLASYLERIGASSNAEISTKVIAICEKYRFRDIISSVSKILTRKFMRLGNIPKALNWCKLIEDDVLTKHLVRKFIWYSMVDGCPEEIFDFRTLPLNSLCEDFSFLLKYSQYNTIPTSMSIHLGQEQRGIFSKGCLSPPNILPNCSISKIACNKPRLTASLQSSFQDTHKGYRSIKECLWYINGQTLSKFNKFWMASNSFSNRVGQPSL